MNTAQREALDELQELLGHTFKDLDLLLRALTHPSYANEEPSARHNQRMEFLGDSVLGLAITTELFERFPQRSEGQLSRLRSALVREETLVVRAEAIKLGPCLRLGRGERKSGGRFKHSLLADAYEAVLAAVYLDADFEAAHKVIVRGFEETFQQIASGNHSRDFKTRLQELIQSRTDARPRYSIVSSDGPPHARRFTAQVTVDDDVLGEGQGMSKKAAQQDAARRALEGLTASSEETAH